MNIEGYLKVHPVITNVKFTHRGKIDIILKDGRIIIVPINAFPKIKRLSLSQRKKIQLLGEGFTFDACNEVFHIEQILGKYENYKHN